MEEHWRDWKGTSSIWSAMHSLIHRLQSNDPNVTTLALTSECEPHELKDFLQALEANTVIHTVVFRESFFALRRIRQHLTFSDFVMYLEAIGRHATESLEILPGMAGLVRGQLVSFLVNSPLKRLVAKSAITFCNRRDVECLAETLGQCPALTHLQLTELFLVTLRQEPILDPLLLHLSSSNTLKVLELSSGKRDYAFSFLSSSMLDAFLSHCPTLEYLSLCKLGLDDGPIQTIARHLAHHPSLKYLLLNDNRQTPMANYALVESLWTNQTVEHLECKSCNDRMEKWALEFWFTPEHWTFLEQVLDQNCTLQTLELWNGCSSNGSCSSYTSSSSSTKEQDGRPETMIPFYLTLNRIGRKQLLQSSLINGLWPLYLEVIQDSPSSMYYFLKWCPGIFVGYMQQP